MSFYVNEAVRFIIKEDYKMALTCLDIALKLNPVNSVAHDWKAVALQELGRYEEALVYRNRAIMCFCNKSYDRPLYYLYFAKGETLFRSGDHEAAISYFSTAFTEMQKLEVIDGAVVNLCGDMGEELCKKGLYKEAIRLFDMLLVLEGEVVFDDIEVDVNEMREKAVSAMS